MEVAAWAAASAAKDAAVAPAKEAAAAEATAKQAAVPVSATALHAKEAAVAVSAAELNAKKAAAAAKGAAMAAAAVKASTTVLDAKEAADLAATLEETAAAATAALQAFKKREPKPETLTLGPLLPAMEAAEVAAWAAASAAKCEAAALAKDAAVAEVAAKEATAAAKEAAVAVAAAELNVKEVTAAAKEAAVAASAVELTAKEAAVKASSAVLDAKEAAAMAATLEEVAAAVTAAVKTCKKRKFHLIDGGEQDTSGSRDINDGDFISHLPDKALCIIVSLLPIKDSVRTQAISRRWRPLWRSTPLNLVGDNEFRSEGRRTVDLIQKILSDHPGPASRFSVHLLMSEYYHKIRDWICSRALDNLQELELTYSVAWVDREKVYLMLLPSSVFRFAPTLCVAKFDNCHFPDLIVQLALKFPSLKQLTLRRVTISEDALHSMLSGCTALESLGLEDNLGTARLCITSQTLKSLGFCADTRFGDRGILQELVIEDTPCLERLVSLYPKCSPPTILIISALKLKIFGVLSKDIAKFQFGTTVFKKMIAVHLATKVHTLRVLVLESAGPNLDAVLNFLKCFPCLERLHVIFQSTRKRMNNIRKYDPLDPIECLELHLREVALKNYDGTKSPSIDFANFFILNAKVLKEMKITLPYHRQQKWFAKQRELLQTNDRASQDARIELKCGSKFFIRNNHTHDLSMADPFDMPYKCGQCL